MVENELKKTFEKKPNTFYYVYFNFTDLLKLSTASKQPPNTS